MCIDVFLLIPTNQLYLLIGQKYSLENNLPISNLSKALPTFAPWIHHTSPWPFGEYLILASILISIRPVQIPMHTCFLRPFQCPKQPFINMEGTVDASEKKKKHAPPIALLKTRVAIGPSQKETLKESIFHKLGGGFKYFFFTPIWGRLPFLTNIFQLG